MSDLLNLYFRLVGNGNRKHTVGLTIRLDAFIYLLLLLGVPDAPVLVAHRTSVHLELRMRRKHGNAEHGCRKTEITTK